MGSVRARKIVPRMLSMVANGASIDRKPSGQGAQGADTVKIGGLLNLQKGLDKVLDTFHFFEARLYNKAPGVRSDV